MLDALIQIAFWTFMLQLVLFVVPVLASAYFCIYGLSAAVKTIFFESSEDIGKYQAEKAAKEAALKRARKESRSSSEETEPVVATLQPLNCPECGGRVPMSSQKIVCPFCRIAVSVPGSYRHILRVREEASRKLKRATLYWRRARFLTSPFLRWVARILAVWLFAAFVMILSVDLHTHLGKYGTWMTERVGLLGIAVLTHFFWILLLFIFSYSFSPRIRSVLPTLEFGEHLGGAEDAGCVQCGAPIRYEANDLAAICGYCGVETWRAKLAWSLHNTANQARQKANFSLIDAKEELSEAIWDALFAPLFLIAIFGFVPLLIVGFTVFIDQPSDNRLFIILGTVSVVGGMLAFANRDELRRTFVKRPTRY